MFGSAYTIVQQHAQETSVESETSVETYNSEEEKGDKEKMRFLNQRFLHILEQDEIRKLRIIESKLQEEREVFKRAVIKITVEYKSKMEKTRITNEEQTTLIQKNTRLETKVKELSKTLKTVTEEIEATRQSLHKYEIDIAEKNLKITEQEGRIKFFENKYRLADEQSKQNLKRIEELIDIVEENKIKQQQDQIRIEALDEQLEFTMTLNKEVNETGRSEYTISKYIIKAKSELQKLMTKITQSYDTALKDYVNQQKVVYTIKVDSLVHETSRRFKSMKINIQEKNKRTTTELVQKSFKQQEDFSQLKTENAKLYEQVLKLQKENARLEEENANLKSHEMVIYKEYHEETASMIKSFIKKTEEIIERRFTEDCYLIPEIATYEACILKARKIWGIHRTDQVFFEIFHDKNLEMIEFEFPPVNEPMRSSSAANGDENAKDMSDDEEEID